jgi:hypothetical protein
MAMGRDGSPSRPLRPFRRNGPALVLGETVPYSPTEAEPTWPLYSSRTDAKPRSADIDEPDDSRGAAAPAATRFRLASRAR